MRSLPIPVCLIAFGVLAALPFRREPDRSVHAVDGADPLAQTVVPLRESPLVTANTPRERPISPLRFASVAHPPSAPPTPWLENRPESYQDVAVPLALPEDEGNIFGSGRANRQPAGRFGIPDDLLAGEDRAVEQKAIPGSRLWEVEQPIPALEAASALISVLEQEPTPQAAKVVPVASKSPAVKNVQPTAEQPSAAPRKRLFIREPPR